MPLLTPVAVAVDSYGNIYTADSSLVLHEGTPAGAWIAVAGNGAPGFAGDGGPAAKAQLSALRDLAFDINGNLLLADGIRIREIASSGTISTIAGDGFLHAVGDGLPAAQAILNQPMGIALDRLGNLYIADA
jgi:DNA-binding beta-propeller fold protein YncE